MHHIQKYIIKTLTDTEIARFRDMRPANVDSNAYSYHLKALQKEGYVEKAPKGYRLSPRGLAHVDKVSLDDFEERSQPKTMIILVLRDAAGRILLHEKRRQPFIGSKLLPSGKMHLDDVSLASAAQRELRERVGAARIELHHAGDVFIRSSIKSELISSYTGYVFTGVLTGSEPIVHNNSWEAVDSLAVHRLAPATKEIFLLTSEPSPFFFHELHIDWEHA